MWDSSAWQSCSSDTQKWKQPLSPVGMTSLPPTLLQGSPGQRTCSGAKELGWDRAELVLLSLSTLGEEEVVINCGLVIAEITGSRHPFFPLPCLTKGHPRSASAAAS